MSDGVSATTTRLGASFWRLFAASSGSNLADGVMQAALPPLSSFAVSAFNVQMMSVRQVLIPDALFGRVQGANRTVQWGSIPLGTAGGGLVAT